MEHLSLLIYIASIADSFRHTMWFLTIVTSTLWVTFTMALLADGFCSAQISAVKLISANLWKVALVTGLLALFTPKQNTVYLMAGSEIDDEIVQSETAQKVKAVLDKKLDEILSDGVKK